MARLREGEQSALSELVCRYQNDIFRFCLHYLRDVELAKEVAQETFVRVYAARQRFDSARRFRPWVLCIARNLCLNELKRKKAVMMESLDTYASAARTEEGKLLSTCPDSPDHHLMTAERHELLARALASLDDVSREIVVLRFFERLSAREIAEIANSTEGAVRTRLHRALRSLRSRYEELKGWA